MNQAESHKSLRARTVAASRSEIARIEANELSSQGSRRQWGVVESDLSGWGHAPYDHWFKGVLPQEVNRYQDDIFRQYIERTLPPKQNRRGLDIGGTGSRLFADFTPGFFSATAGVSLTDLRWRLSDPTIYTADEQRNHTVITGDILHDDTKEKVLTWANGEKIDLIISRMYHGIETLPDEPFFMSEEANFWYKLLAEGGLMFVQIPDALTPYIEKWRDFINTHYHDKLDVQIDQMNISRTPQSKPNYTVLRLHKLPGAPEELPLLDAQSVMKGERENRYPQRTITTSSQG